MANLSILIDNSATAATLTEIGGQGTPESPREWRVTSSKPLFAQPSLNSFRRGVKSRDQVVHKYRVPYTVTSADTSQEMPVSFALATVTYDLARDVPQSVSDYLVKMVATAENYHGTSNNLLPATQARQAY